MLYSALLIRFYKSSKIDMHLAWSFLPKSFVILSDMETSYVSDLWRVSSMIFSQSGCEVVRTILFSYMSSSSSSE